MDNQFFPIQKQQSLRKEPYTLITQTLRNDETILQLEHLIIESFLRQ
jgi:hypothetical protein